MIQPTVHHATGTAPPDHTSLMADAATNLAAITRNEGAFQSLLDSTSLPAPTWVPLPDAVYVSATDVDYELGEWLAALGGHIRVHPPADGVQLWILHTSMPTRDGSLPILVSVPVPEGLLIPDYLRAAVNSSPDVEHLGTEVAL